MKNVAHKNGYYTYASNTEIIQFLKHDWIQKNSVLNKLFQKKYTQDNYLNVVFRITARW